MMFKKLLYLFSLKLIAVPHCDLDLLIVVIIIIGIVIIAIVIILYSLLLFHLLRSLSCLFYLFCSLCSVLLYNGLMLNYAHDCICSLNQTRSQKKRLKNKNFKKIQKKK